ncbi:MAG: hypothetical protein ACRDZ6_06215 [Acidimicrobiales bacterium]
MRTGPWWARSAGALLARPWLWPALCRQIAAMVPPRWWCRRPPLPLPSKAWLGFRMETAYGDASSRPEPGDVISWLEWCREGGAPVLTSWRRDLFGTPKSGSLRRVFGTKASPR